MFTFGKEADLHFAAADGSQLVAVTENGHLRLCVGDARGNYAEFVLAPSREKADATVGTSNDPQFTLLQCLSAAVEHAAATARRLRAGEVEGVLKFSAPAAPGRNPLREDRPRRQVSAQAFERQAARAVRYQRDKRIREGGKFVLFADENDTSATADSLRSDFTIPIAMSERGALVTAVRRANLNRGSRPNELWSNRPDGAWLTEDFTVTVNEAGHYVVAVDPNRARETSMARIA